MNGKSVVGQLGILVGLVFFAVGAIVWTNREHQVPADGVSAAGEPIEVTLVVRTQTDTLLSTSVRDTGVLTALEVLERAADRREIALGIRDYDFGRLVVSIGGITSGPDGDWTYTVNGDLMPVGAGSCVLAAGDVVEFRFGTAPDSLNP